MTNEVWDKMSDSERKAVLHWARLQVRLIKAMHGLYRPLTGVTRGI